MDLNKDLTSKICKHLMHLNIKKKNSQIKKMDGIPKWTVLQKDIQMAKRHMKDAQ